VLSGVERNLQTQILTAALVPEPDLPKALASQMDKLDLRLLYPCLVKGAEAFLRMTDSKELNNVHLHLSNGGQLEVFQLYIGWTVVSHMLLVSHEEEKNHIQHIFNS
jgi:hypothetical protein